MTGEGRQEYVSIHMLVLNTTTSRYTMTSLDTYDPPPAHEDALIRESQSVLSDSGVGVSSALSPPFISTSRRSSITSCGGSSRVRRTERQDDNVMMAPFVHPLQALANLQQQLLADRARDWQHEREENSRKRRFHRRSELMKLEGIKEIVQN